MHGWTKYVMRRRAGDCKSRTAGDKTSRQKKRGGGGANAVEAVGVDALSSRSYTV